MSQTKYIQRNFLPAVHRGWKHFQGHKFDEPPVSLLSIPPPSVPKAEIWTSNVPVPCRRPPAVLITLGGKGTLGVTDEHVALVELGWEGVYSSRMKGPE